VDDQPDAREVLLTLLGRAGADVAAAGSAADAFDWLQQHDPDVLLCDIAMPGETGYDLIRRLRRVERTRRLPALALTAHARPEDREQALAVGFQGHIAKPVDPVELLKTVAAVVGTPRAPHLGN
jgi:CheY-like chemotaxis protein